MDLDLDAMNVGDTVEIGVNDWEDGSSAEFKIAAAYAFANWPVQFEASTHWRVVPPGVQQRYFVLTRTR